MGRTGKFMVGFDIIENESLKIVLGKIGFVPLRVEYMFHLRQFEYIGYSDLFDDIGFGMKIQEYELIINDLDKNNILVEARKI